MSTTLTEVVVVFGREGNRRLASHWLNGQRKGNEQPEYKPVWGTASCIFENLYFTRMNTLGSKQTENNKLINLTINRKRVNIYSMMTTKQSESQHTVTAT